MSQSPFVIEVNEDNFDHEILLRSSEIPILLDFWAPWCGPCQSLGPMLEKLAESYQGKFLLGKVNVDENATLAAKYQAKNIPTVKLIKDGQVKDGFVGAVAESEVCKLLDQFIPRASDAGRKAALQLVTEGKLNEALSSLVNLREEDPLNFEIPKDISRLQIKLNQFSQAENGLLMLPFEIRQEEDVKTMLALIAFGKRTENAEDEFLLASKIKSDPTDCHSKIF